MKKPITLLSATSILISGCATIVDPDDSSPPELRLTYTDAAVSNAEFESGRTSISYDERPLRTRINALGTDEQSGIASVELTITADVVCRGTFPGESLNWASHAEWTVRSGSPADPGEEDFVSSNAIAYLSVDRFAREADCFNNPTRGEPSKVYVNVLDAHAFARVCNNTSDRANRCVTDGVDFNITGEMGTAVER